MIQLENCAGQPLFVRVENIAAFGKMDESGSPSLKSYVLMAGASNMWELRTPYEDLERMILEATAPSCCKSSGIEYL